MTARLLGEHTPAGADGAPFSELAWELARRAVFTSPRDRVRATIRRANGDQVHGFGDTSTEAMRNLARALMVLSEASEPTIETED